MHEIPFQRVQLIRDGSLPVERVAIGSTGSAKALFETYFADLGETRETFVVATLDASRNATAIVHVSTGTVSNSIVHPREVYRVAVMNGASSIIVAHNHPSGDATPSDDDLETTARLAAAGEILGISLIDHIIVGNTVISLRDLGHLLDD